MNKVQALQYINAQAQTPDQLLSYVTAVSGAQSELVGDYVVHRQDSHIILVGYALRDAKDTTQLDDTISQLIAKQDAENITVLAPIRPSLAPNDALSIEDAYWFVQLPLVKQGVKVRNMLSHAKRNVEIKVSSGQGSWTGAHQEMMLAYIRNKGMESALCSILQRLGTYLMTTPEAMIFSAYNKDTNELLSCALADFSSFSTAFYMFAFRQEKALAGVSDAVLYALLNEAASRGHANCNLGLGINDGIRFFKQKWGAHPSLPFVQTTWPIKIQKKSWFSRFID